jgi:hypothetical protein
VNPSVQDALLATFESIDANPLDALAGSPGRACACVDSAITGRNRRSRNRPEKECVDSLRDETEDEQETPEKKSLKSGKDVRLKPGVLRNKVEFTVLLPYDGGKCLFTKREDWPRLMWFAKDGCRDTEPTFGARAPWGEAALRNHAKSPSFAPVL